MTETMERLKLDYKRVGDGYLVVQHEGRQLLLDTGAPFSFGKGLKGIPGVAKTPLIGLDNGLTIEWLINHIGHPFDGLIGAEILNSHSVLIEPDENAIIFTQELMDGSGGVPIEGFSNVPVLEGVINGHSGKVILDTGACLGFVPRAFANGFSPVDTQPEFYPLFGEFETDVFELPMIIGAESLNLRFGVFPEEIEKMHAVAGFPALIGLELLDYYRISLGLREQRLSLQKRSSLAIS